MLALLQHLLRQVQQSLVGIGHQLLFVQYLRQVLDLDAADSIHNYRVAETVLAAYTVLVDFLYVFDSLAAEFVLSGDGSTWNCALKAG